MVEEGRLNVIWSDLSVLDILAAETDGLKQGEGQCIQLYCLRVTIPCNLWPLFTSVQMMGTHWLVDAVHPFGMYPAVSGMDRLKPVC